MPDEPSVPAVPEESPAGTPDETPVAADEVPAAATDAGATPDPGAAPDHGAGPDAGVTPGAGAAPPNGAPGASGPDETPADEVPSDASGSRASAAAPDEATLARIATPATVRRAPRFGAFITAGALAGLVIGVVLATVFDTGALAGDGGVLPFLGGANGARAVTGLALAVVGALVGALLALWADRRSLRR